MTAAPPSRSGNAGLGADALILSLMLVTAWVVTRLDLGYFARPGEQAALAFGFLLLIGHLFGRIAHRFGAPRLVGYLLTGLLAGPSVWGASSHGRTLLTPAALETLSVFKDTALGIIAFTAGGEIDWAGLRARGRKNAVLMTSLIACVMATTALAMLALRGRVDALAALPDRHFEAVTLLACVVAASFSPAVTIAVLVETRARGPFSSALLGLVVLSDVAIIVLMSPTLPIASILTHGGGWDWTLTALLPWRLLGSFGFGALLGAALGRYLAGGVPREAPALLLGLAYVAYAIAEEFYLSGLLLCLSAGMWVANRTPHGRAFVEATERFSLPVFVMFFVLAGAGVSLDRLIPIVGVVAAFVAARISGVWMGLRVGAWAAREDNPDLRGRLWMGFVSQAGVSIGLVTVIGRELPELPELFGALVISAIAVNEMIGPLLLRRALVRSGETGALA